MRRRGGEWGEDQPCSRTVWAWRPAQPTAHHHAHPNRIRFANALFLSCSIATSASSSRLLSSCNGWPDQSDQRDQRPWPGRRRATHKRACCLASSRSVKSCVALSACGPIRAPLSCTQPIRTSYKSETLLPSPVPPTLSTTYDHLSPINRTHAPIHHCDSAEKIGSLLPGSGSAQG